MLYELARELDARLQSKGIPLRVNHGPGDGAIEARPILSPVRGRIVLERDRRAGDAFPAPRSAGVRGSGAGAAANETRVVWGQEIRCVCRVVAASTLAGARLHEHEELCDRIVRHVVIGLRHVITSRKHVWIPPTRGHYLTAEELKIVDLEQWSGVVYDIEFSVERGLFDSDWDNQGQPLGTIAHVVHTGCKEN